MMYMMYPDGTRELHDSGLIVSVRRGVVMQATLALLDHELPLRLDVDPGDARQGGYLGQKHTHAKWVAQLSGKQPIPTVSDPAWRPTDGVRAPRPRRARAS